MNSVTRRETFNAAHRLYNQAKDEAWNQEVYGKCANPSGHGHNYALDVTVAGDIDADTGYVFDLKILGDIVRKVIVEEVDHRHLNVDVEWLRGLNPTAEILARAFFDRLEPHLPGLHAVRLWETDKNWADHSRPSGGSSSTGTRPISTTG